MGNGMKPALSATIWICFIIALFTVNTGSARAVELCSREGNNLMLKVGIRRAKINALCRKLKERGARLAISVRRSENELGYCRVTLALKNNSTEYLNRLILTSAGGKFEIFRFHNIMPGSTGFTSAKSRILIGCDELRELKIRFNWPAGIQAGDRILRGRGLERYKPVLEKGILVWNGQHRGR